MPARHRYLLNRDGRYYARIVIPQNLRPFMGDRTEMRTPLGADRLTAIRHLPIAVADIMHQIAAAEKQAADDTGREQPRGRFPMTDAQLAQRSYQQRLKQDAEARLSLTTYAKIDIDDGFAALIRAGIAGAASDAELEEVVGHRINHYRRLGNTTAERGTREWRSLAMALCVSEYEALERMSERDEGVFSGIPRHPLIRDAAPQEPDLPPVSIRQLFKDYVRARSLIGSGREAERRWKSVFEDLRKFLKHDDARKLTKGNLIAWRDSKMEQGLAPKTVSGVYLASVRTVLNWAIENDRIPGPNPALDVRQPTPKRIRNRERGYTALEAGRVIAACAAYQPRTYVGGTARESARTTAARCWIPLLCAFSGARVTEIAQLRKQDIRKEQGRWIMRLTPDAGTIKTGEYRDVPLHFQIIEQGFEEFILQCQDGPIFYTARGEQDPIKTARSVGINLGKRLRGMDLVPDGVSPNHGFRHFFKTAGRQAGIEDRVLDALQGHAARSAGDDYGDVTIATRINAVDKLPTLHSR